MTNPNDPVSPMNLYDFQPTSGEQVVREQMLGLTKREMFAMVAMQGILASTPKDSDLFPLRIVLIATEHADALINALNIEYRTKESATFKHT